MIYFFLISFKQVTLKSPHTKNSFTNVAKKIQANFSKSSTSVLIIHIIYWSINQTLFIKHCSYKKNVYMFYMFKNCTIQKVTTDPLQPPTDTTPPDTHNEHIIIIIKWNKMNKAEHRETREEASSSGAVCIGKGKTVQNPPPTGSSLDHRHIYVDASWTDAVYWSWRSARPPSWMGPPPVVFMYVY